MAKKNKSTINPKNDDDKCFQYAITVALNHEQIKKDPQRIPKIKTFIDKNDWKERNFPLHKNDWNEFEKNNKRNNTEEIRHAYKSKHDLSSENQVILLMITDSKKWHYLAMKKFSARLR